VRDNADGTYLVRFLPPLRGSYSISVCCASSRLPVQGSPFSLATVSNSKLLVLVNGEPLRMSCADTSLVDALASATDTSEEFAYDPLASSVGDSSADGGDSSVDMLGGFRKPDHSATLSSGKPSLTQPFRFLFEFDEEYFQTRNPQQVQQNRSLQVCTEVSLGTCVYGLCVSKCL
jgi:Filamin/ABP280 repeat